MPYDGLLFSFAEMEQEIENLRLFARQYLERNSFERVIPDWKSELKAFRSQAPGTTMNWGIKQASPIETIISPGSFDRTATMKVFAKISGTWNISIPKEPDGKMQKKGVIRDKFLLNGLASTLISIWKVEENAAEPVEIARWSLDIGDRASPGCHFHSQIPLKTDGGGMFPSELPVPRLPTFHHTPMDALEFVLSELFQDAWQFHASKNAGPQLNWGGCQRRRIKRLLTWQLKCIDGSTASAWTAIKQNKPSIDMLFG